LLGVALAQTDFPPSLLSFLRACAGACSIFGEPSAGLFIEHLSPPAMKDCWKTSARRCFLIVSFPRVHDGCRYFAPPRSWRRRVRRRLGRSSCPAPPRLQFAPKRKSTSPFLFSSFCEIRFYLPSTFFSACITFLSPLPPRNPVSPCSRRIRFPYSPSFSADQSPPLVERAVKTVAAC